MKNKRKHPLRNAFLVFLAAVVLFFCFGGYTVMQKTRYPLKYDTFVQKYAEEYHIPVSLVYSVIRTESSFRPEVKSHAGAIGLMQVKPVTFEWAQMREGKKKSAYLGENALYDPETNIRYGTYILSLLYQLFSHTDTVLAAYNAGQGSVAKWLKNADYSHDGETLYEIPFGETKRYVSRVNTARIHYQKLYQLS